MDSNPIERFKRWFVRLPKDNQLEILRFVIENKPQPHQKLSKQLGYENTGKAFDLDLIEGQFGEGFPPGKYEFKEDFKLSETGNVAIELSCFGEPSGISTTEADWWVLWFMGEEYQKESGFIVATHRLRRITDGCWIEPGGDNKEARNALVPKNLLLASNSQIEKKRQKQGPQISMFGEADFT